MTTTTADELARKKCAPCEGGVPPIGPEDASSLLSALPGWTLTHDGKRIRREWRVRDFMAGLDFFQQVAQIAQAEDHHPDLHLTGYREVAIELSTHAVAGLTENDFILAAKIDGVPVTLKK